MPGETPGCLPGLSNQFLVNSGATCNGAVASGGPHESWYGPEGCGVPNAGGNNGDNIADCWIFHAGVTAAEITLAVTNATKVSLSLSSFPLAHPLPYPYQLRLLALSSFFAPS